MGKRIYISGAITDNPDYINDFRNAEMRLFRKYLDADWEYHEIINPVKVAFALPSSFTHEEYMAVDMILLTKCDAIYMLKNYKNSKGALAELIIAKQMGLKVLYEEEGD